jgi:hypothetical protein
VHSLGDARSGFLRSVEGHLYNGANRPSAESYQLMFPLSLVTFAIEENSIEWNWTKMIRGRIIGVSGFDMWAAVQERRTEA